jgi:two-component system, NarL family, sensor kinase
VLTDDELSLLATAGALVSLAVERSRLESARVRGLAAEQRNHLAREIHDTIAQSLAALTMQLEAADARAGAQADPKLGQAIDGALALARSILDEARRSVLDLRDTPLEGRTLYRALERLAEEMRADSRAPAVRVTADGFDRDDGDLPAAVEVGLYRIAQQALANTIRHAGASRVDLRLSREPAGVHLRLKDDGEGFDPAKGSPGRFGLIGMRERARLLGGAFTVESSPGRGTVIHVVVPLGSASNVGTATP